MKKIKSITEKINHRGRLEKNIEFDSQTQYIIYGGQFADGMGGVLEQMIHQNIKESHLLHKRKFKIIGFENGQDIVWAYEKMIRLNNPPKFVLVASKYRDNFDNLKLCQHIDTARRIHQHDTKIFSHSIDGNFNQRANECGVVDGQIDKTNLKNLSYRLMINLVTDSLQ